MKLFGLVLAQAGLASAKTDVHFNHNHEHGPEIAHLEKWNALARKFFRMHEADLRPRFFQNWAGTDGTDGRFQREINKLEKAFKRKCSRKDLIPRQSIGDHFVTDGETTPDERKRRADGQLRVANNPGHRMRHILRNVEKWAEDFLHCSNQKKVTSRWQRFMSKWESEIAKNPIFQEEFKKEERYLRNYDGPGRPCGRIYREFGLHGKYMEILDASIDSSYGFGDLGQTDFGNDQLMSMVPFEGCYIRAYQHYNKEGYSSICSDTHGCSVTAGSAGALTENQASSVYCYCDAPKPKYCGVIYKHDGKDRTRDGYASIYDGAKLGFKNLNHPPVYVPNDELSSIRTYRGCQIDIWEDTGARGDHYTCPGDRHWCFWNSLGKVGNDEASTITCKCPVKFLNIYYDTPPSDWDLDMDGTSVQLHQLSITNDCDPDLVSDCADQSYQWSESKTLTSEHNWGNVFKAGVSYTEEASASFKGFGVSEWITMTAEESWSTGGSKSVSQTVSSTTPCVAKPMTRVNCQYMAFKGKIEIGFTIEWENSEPSRGTYIGEGWKSDLITTEEPL